MALTKITSRILDSSGVTILGTIATGVWQGTAINQTYLVGQSGTNTGDETLARINALDVTELGTVSSGVWNGTAIASAYLDADTAHLSTTQTFTGAKTFSSTVTTGGAIANPFKITANPGTRSLKLTSASTNFGTWISWLRGNETYEKAYLGFTSTSDDVFEVNNRENADMTFHTNTNERVRILAGGNVGIGTSSPGQKLVIGGGTNGRVRIKVTEAVNNFGKFEFSTSDSATSSATMIAEITAKITQAHSSSLKSDLSFSTNSGDSLTERMHISSGGTINLKVMSTADAEGYVKMGRFDGNTSRYNQIKNKVSGTQASNFMKLSVHNGTENSTTDAITILGNGKVGIGTTSPNRLLDVDGVIGFSDNDVEQGYISPTSTGTDLTLKQSGSNVIRFDSRPNANSWINAGSGGVGIGTTSPNQKLTIGFANNGTDGISFRSTTYASLGKILCQNDNASTNGNLQFLTRVGGDVIERMRISSGGDVNIGTSDGLPLMHGSVAGNASYCSYSFVGDPNTGMIRTGADTLALVTGASPRLTISSGGNATFSGSIALGGATIANSYLLEITAASGNIMRSTRGSSQFSMYQANNGGVFLGTTGNNDLRFIQNDGDALIIDTNKRVGIGTTSPSAKLSVFGSQAAIDFQRGSGDSKWEFSSDAVNLYIAEMSTGSRSYKMTISEGGNFGIGFSGYSSYRVVIRGASSTSSDYAFRTENSGTYGMLQNRNDGLFQTGDAPQSPYRRTTSNSANTHVASNGALERSTASSKRFKDNITEWNESGLNTILALKPKTFTYKKEHYFKPDRQFLGLIAEEVADVSGYLADYENEDGSGQIENVRYANIVVPLIKAIQEQQTIIEDLKSRIEIIEG